MRRKIRVALRIMFNNNPDGIIELFVVKSRKRKGEAISFCLVQVEHWTTGKIYFSLEFHFYNLEESPDFSIKEALIK